LNLLIRAVQPLLFIERVSYSNGLPVNSRIYYRDAGIRCITGARLTMLKGTASGLVP
jgi:hypothetical protein